MAEGAPEVPEFVRGCLAHYRAEGLPFMVAWTRTLQAIPRGTNVAVIRQRREWVEILKWGRPAWQAAYDGLTLGELLALEEREPAARALQLVV